MEIYVHTCQYLIQLYLGNPYSKPYFSNNGFGRTHQIRAHLASLGAPLAGDAIYGGVSGATQAAAIGRTLLHAWELAFRHPATGNACTVRAPLPFDMRAALDKLGLPKPAWSDHMAGC